MKTITKLLLAVFMGAFSINSFAQTSKLMGMTSQGGKNNTGTIFMSDMNGENQEVIYDFLNWDGCNPYGSLMQATNGKLYGMTQGGGGYNYGVIFEYDPVSRTFSRNFTFDGVEGAYPYGALIQATNGKLYGMAQVGGEYGDGVIFEYDPDTKKFTKKFDFSWWLDRSDGYNPYGSLIQATNGKLYGMTAYGGTSDAGVLFEYNLDSGTFTKKIDFDLVDKGANPYGSLIQATNGKLYGMTYGGGSNAEGVLFEYDPASETFTKKLDFDRVDKGANPYGSLIQATNGKLYGTTYQGGSYGDGVLFEYDPASGTFTKKLDFDGADEGANSYGSLMQASNGKLYGMTLYGGINGCGVFFEYDPASGTFTKKLDFDWTNGAYPFYSNLIEISGNVGVKTNDDISNVSVFPNPSSGTVSIEGLNIKSLTINDLNGKIVFNKIVGSNKTELDLSNLPKGIYLIKTETEKGLKVEKLILR